MSDVAVWCEYQHHRSYRKQHLLLTERRKPSWRIKTLVVNSDPPAVSSFGVQGWNYGDPKVTSITFFLDNTCKVSDQWGRPIRGTVVDNKEVKFADTAPVADHSGVVVPRPQFATHEQVVAALTAERVDWQKLPSAGWPQLRYEALKGIDPAKVPYTPVEELKKIRDQQLRRDALRLRRELDEDRAKESAATAEE